MNILEQEDIVKGMPDEVLIAQSQNPTGGIPQFLLVSEIQRREKMRANYQGDQQQMPMPTVTEQVVQQGIASLNPAPDPLMNTAMGIPQQPMMTAAGGGMMPYRMDAGRGVPFPEEFFEMSLESLPDFISKYAQSRGADLDQLQPALFEYALKHNLNPQETIERLIPSSMYQSFANPNLFPGMERVSKTIDKFAGDAAKTDVAKIEPGNITEELITMAGAPNAGAENKFLEESEFSKSKFVPIERNDKNIFLEKLPGYISRAGQAIAKAFDESDSRQQTYGGPGQFIKPKNEESNNNESKKSEFILFPQAVAAGLNERGPAGADFGSGPPEVELSPFGPYRDGYKFDGRVQPKSKNLGDQLTKFVSEDSPDVKDYRDVLEAMLGRAYKPMDEGALALVNLGAGIAKGDIGAGLLGATKAIGEERDRTRKDMVARATAAYYLGGGRGSKGTADSALFRQALTDINREFAGRAKLAEEYKKRVGNLPPDGQAAKTALEKFKNFLIMERARLYAQMNQQYGGTSFGPAGGSAGNSQYNPDSVYADVTRSMERNRLSE